MHDFMLYETLAQPHGFAKSLLASPRESSARWVPKSQRARIAPPASSPIFQTVASSDRKNCRGDGKTSRK